MHYTLKKIEKKIYYNIFKHNLFKYSFIAFYLKNKPIFLKKYFIEVGLLKKN